MKRCVDCGQDFDPRESLMGDEGQCQMCWEAQCDRSWWELMRLLDIRDGREHLEMPEVGR